MDHYNTLGVSKTASQDEIKKAFRLLALKNHPDRGGDEKIFKEINNAYEILSNEEKRKAYDNPQEHSMHDNNMPDFFKHMFGMHNNNDNSNKKPVIRISHEMTLEEIFTGMTVTKEYEHDSPCTVCKETGFEDCQNRDCKTCGGTGVVIKLVQVGPGILTQSKQQCTSCPSSSDNPKCKTCNGSKNIQVKDSVIFNIPKSVPHRKIIQVERPDHNIVIIIEEKSHQTYKRQFEIDNKKITPLDLLVRLDITLCESLCGFRKELTWLDGSKISIYEEDIIQNNQIKVLIGKGLEHHKKNYLKGNIYIEYSIQYPTSLEHKQKKLIFYALTGSAMEDYTITHELSTKDIDENNTDFHNNNDDDNHMPQQMQCVHQ